METVQETGYFKGLKFLKYKRASGTRWVAHQVDSTSSFLRNLPILLGFLNHQINTPYNKSMKGAKPTLMGHLKNASKLEIVIYLAARQDILAYLSPELGFGRPILVLPRAVGKYLGIFVTPRFLAVFTTYKWVKWEIRFLPTILLPETDTIMPIRNVFYKL